MQQALHRWLGLLRSYLKIHMLGRVAIIFFRGLLEVGRCSMLCGFLIPTSVEIYSSVLNSLIIILIINVAQQMGISTYTMICKY